MGHAKESLGDLHLYPDATEEIKDIPSCLVCAHPARTAKWRGVSPAPLSCERSVLPAITQRNDTHSADPCADAWCRGVCPP